MLIYAAADLIFATKIKGTADALGVTTRPARDAAMLANRLNQVDDGKPNDAVSAVVVDMDLGDTALALIEQTKAHDPAIPVFAFGSHVAVQLLRSAESAGADAVMARSAFTQQLPEILRQYGGWNV